MVAELIDMSRESTPGTYGLFIIETGDEVVEITGTFVASASTRGPDMRPQWTKLTVYRLPDGTYVLVRTGKSVQYHADGSVCNTGVRQKVGDLTDAEYESLVGCKTCKVQDLDDLPEDSFISKEIDWNTVVDCDSPASLIDKLQVTDHSTGERYLSGVAERLLREAAPFDDGIRGAITKRRKLGA